MEAVNLTPSQQHLIGGIAAGYSISKFLDQEPCTSAVTMYQMAMLMEYGFEIPEEVPEEEGFFLFDAIFAGLSKRYPQASEEDIIAWMGEVFAVEDEQQEKN